MTVSKIFLYFCLSFIGGIFLSSYLCFGILVKAGLIVFGILFISVFWGRRNLTIAGFCLLFLVLGIWRYETAEIKTVANEFKKYNDSGKEIVLTGLILEEPDIRHNHIKLEIGKIDFIENEFKRVSGKILITTEKYPEYKYGDKLKISGKPLTPQEFEDFNYKDYLAKDGIYSVLYYPEIELIEKDRGNFVYAGILSFKNKLREVIYRNLSLPQSSILAAMILGDKSQISQEWKEKLNYAGLRHLTAISGMHVAILTVILMKFLIGLGLWRHQAFYFAIILIVFFIIMTGLQPSAVRAGIMGGLFLFAQYLGRMNMSPRAIVFAASFMLIHNPLLLKLDIGFQLSFLAMLGIIYCLPIFQKLLHKFPDFFQLKNILAMTLSAQIFTLPILIYNFGYFSMVAPFSNVLVVPFLPFILGLGLVFAVFGVFSEILGWLFSLPVWLLLTYLIKITEWFSGLSFSFYIIRIHWLWLPVCYLILFLFIWRFNRKHRLEFLKYQ